MTPKVNTKPRNNPPNPLPNVTSDLDSDPIFQIILHHNHLTHQTTSIVNKDDVQKKEKINTGVKFVSMAQSKIAQRLKAKLLPAAYKSKVFKFRLYKYPL